MIQDWPHAPSFSRYIFTHCGHALWFGAMSQFRRSLLSLKRLALESPLRVIYPLAIVNSLLLIMIYGVVDFPDSQSYITAIDNLLCGEIDQFRTPIYPLFLALCRSVVGVKHYLLFAIMLQHIFYIVSSFYFSLLLRKMNVSRPIHIILLTIYLLHPGFTTYCNRILTEVFAVGGLVFLLFEVWNILNGERRIHIIGFFFLLFFLVFLRPSFVYLLPLFFVVFLWSFFKSRLKVAMLSALGAVVVVSLLLFGYMKVFERKYHVYSITAISTINMYHNIRMMGLVDTTTVMPEAMRHDIAQSVAQRGMVLNSEDGIWNESTALIEHYGELKVQQFVDAMLKTNKVAYMKKVIGRVYRSDSSLLLTCDMAPLSTFIDITLPIHMYALYWMLFIYGIVLCFYSISHHVFPIFSTLLFFVSVGLVFVVLIGAYGQWGRLVLPIIPLVMLMAGQLLSMVRVRLRPRNERRMV